MKQTIYFALGLIAVFLFGAWGHSLYTRHFDKPATLSWQEEANSALKEMDSIHAMIRANSTVFKDDPGHMYINIGDLLDILGEKHDVICRNHFYGDERFSNYSLVLRRHPDGRPKLVTFDTFVIADRNEKTQRIVNGITLSRIRLDDLNAVVGYSVNNGEYLSAVFDTTCNHWRCSDSEYTRNDVVSINTDFLVTDPDHCVYFKPKQKHTSP